VPDFEKFDRSSNPLIHFKSYYSKIVLWSRDDKFLIHFFKKWVDVLKAFMSQYKFNLSTAPTREELRGMKKKANETFKEYAQR